MRVAQIPLIVAVVLGLTHAGIPTGYADPDMADDQQPDSGADGDGWQDKYGTAPDANSWKDKYTTNPDAQGGGASQDTSGSAPAGDEWPRKLTTKGYTVYLYAPQLESWDQTQNTLQGRAAVSVQSADAGSPVYGVIWLSAQTQTDPQSQQVTLTNVQVTKASFPSQNGEGDDYLALMREVMPNGVRTMSLAQLQSDLNTTKELQKTRKVAVKNDPPRIIFSPARAMLILVDGQPVTRPVPGTQLSRVINTKALILRDQSGAYFLYLIDRWLQAPAIEGPWSETQNATPEMETAKQDAVAAKKVDLSNQAGSDARMAADFESFPTVIVSTARAAALIQTQGPPQLEPVEGTQLQFVTNTFDNIFLDTTTNTYYALISGRWFRSPSLQNGPWAYVSAKALPADFARIPEGHVASDVLPSVAGTPQAQMALVDNSMPQTATVNRQQATLTVTYDGEPQFKPIEGTHLRYAANSSTPVIAANGYYAVDNGVWFQSDAPTGPWVVATSVPDEVYAIPGSSPVYYVTYVRVYDSTADEVVVGYTPGYFGAVVSDDDVVVYGTGWEYPPWVGSYWIGAPLTYGLGAAWDWDAVAGYGWGFAGNGWVLPWWGPVGWGWAGSWNGNLWDLARYDPYAQRWANAVRRADAAGVQDYRLAGWRSGLYAGADGRVYRRGEQGWEYHGGGGDWRRAAGGAGLERDAMSRLSFSRMGGGFRGGVGGFRGGGRR